MPYKIVKIDDGSKKIAYIHAILEKLPEWFDDLQEYDIVLDYPFWAAFSGARCVGFIVGKIHYAITGEVYVFGLDPAYHRKGIGTILYTELENYFLENNCNYAVVRTVSEQADCEPYERTRKFYRKMGFEDLFAMAEIWDEDNPCLVMIKKL
jgi:ribosomal protein S18 acetylase RimI-like enzyme